MADQDRLPAAEDAACIDIDQTAEGIRTGRWFVVAQVRSSQAADLADDAGLLATEMLANAQQHGTPPVTLCVSAGPDVVRIEVRDQSPLPPLRLAGGVMEMTGRGIAMLDAVATRWGVHAEPSGGKVVWCELDLRNALGSEQEPSRLPAGTPASEAAARVGHFTVVLGDVPTDLLLAAKAHVDNVARELSLIALGRAAPGADVPGDVARSLEAAISAFADARVAIKQQAVAAAARDEPRTKLTLRLPLSAADAGEAYLAALEIVDDYARAARLLTLETPPDHGLFRRWYVGAAIAQLRRSAAGRRPSRIPSFEDHLLTEVRRLTSVQRASDRAARLQRVTAALARARTPEDVADVVVSEGVDALGASGGGLLVPDPDGEHLAVPGVVGYGEELVGQLREERLDAPLPAATALRTGRPVWLESQADRDRTFPMLAGFESLTVAMCAVPLILAGRPLGALRFSFDARKLFGDDERSFVLALAAHTAATLERTENYAEERSAALDLQRALLPQEIAEMPGWDYAAHYSPAGNEEAGGDFYDVIPLPDGRVAAVIGDVMGRGVYAAAAMAQVRSTLRAYALDDPDPATVFRRVDRFFGALDLEQLVTALYLVIDTATGAVQLANAGHIPPLLARPGTCEVIAATPGAPFGTINGAREATALTVPPGSALVLITDGLIERRHEDIDVGIARVVSAARSAAGRAASALIDRILDASAGSAQDDDVTALVLLRKAAMPA